MRVRVAMKSDCGTGAGGFKPGNTCGSQAGYLAALDRAGKVAVRNAQDERIASGQRGLNKTERDEIYAAARSAERTRIRNTGFRPAPPPKPITKPTVSQDDARAAIDRVVSRLQSAGWKISGRSPESDSVYLTNGQARVRVSDHELPTSDSRQHAESLGHNINGIVVVSENKRGEFLLSNKELDELLAPYLDDQ